MKTLQGINKPELSRIKWIVALPTSTSFAYIKYFKLKGLFLKVCIIKKQVLYIVEYRYR